MKWFKNLPLRWKLPIFFAFVDFVYLTVVLCVFEGGQKVIIGEFFHTLFAVWLNFFWHFPFAYILWGNSNLLDAYFLPIQTFALFYLIGLWIEKTDSRIPKIVIVTFYLLMTGFAVITAWGDRTREQIVMVLPNGYKGIFVLKTKVTSSEEIKSSNNQYRVEIPESGCESVKNEFDGWHSYSAVYQDGTTITFGDEYLTPVNVNALYVLNTTNDGNFYFVGNNLDFVATKSNWGDWSCGRGTGGVSNYKYLKYKDVMREQKDGHEFFMRKFDSPNNGNLEFFKQKGSLKPIHYFTDDLDAKPLLGNSNKRIVVKNYEYPLGTPYSIWLVDLMSNIQIQIDKNLPGYEKGKLEPSFSPDDNDVLLIGSENAYVVEALTGKELRRFAKDKIPTKWW